MKKCKEYGIKHQIAMQAFFPVFLKLGILSLSH